MKIYKKEPEISNYFNMRGRSMFPILRPGEGVTIDTEIDKRTLRGGDIIIYPAPGDAEKNVIHRIVKICKDGYITRGDNNRVADNYIVKFDVIHGKAMTVRRGDRTFWLAGGFKGRAVHVKLKIRKYCLIHFSKPLVLVSKLIEESGVFNVFHRFVKFDVISVKKGDGFKEMLIRKQKLIGEKCSDCGKWKIRTPYKYFLDKGRLP